MNRLLPHASDTFEGSFEVAYDVLKHTSDRLKQNAESSLAIPEYLFVKGDPKSYRVLTQTRAIISLVKLGQILLESRLSGLAHDVYRFNRNHFMDALKGDGCNLYDLSFIIYSLSALIADGKEKESYYSDLEISFSHLEKKCNSDELFKSRHGEFPYEEQNSAMHLVEALGSLRQHKITDSELLTKTCEILFEKFYDPQSGLVAERLDDRGAPLSFEIGHCFEWSSLIEEMCLPSPYTPDSKSLYKAACERAEYLPNGIIINSYTGALKPAATDERIWPSLEFIRAGINLKSDNVEKYLKDFNFTFFYDNRFKEHISDKNLFIKTTSVYHLVECFKLGPKVTFAITR